MMNNKSAVDNINASKNKANFKFCSFNDKILFKIKDKSIMLSTNQSA